MLSNTIDALISRYDHLGRTTQLENDMVTVLKELRQLVADDEYRQGIENAGYRWVANNKPSGLVITIDSMVCPSWEAAAEHVEGLVAEEKRKQEKAKFDAAVERCEELGFKLEVSDYQKKGSHFVIPFNSGNGHWGSLEWCVQYAEDQAAKRTPPEPTIEEKLSALGCTNIVMNGSVCGESVKFTCENDLFAFLCKCTAGDDWAEQAIAQATAHRKPKRSKPVFDMSREEVEEILAALGGPGPLYKDTSDFRSYLKDYAWGQYDSTTDTILLPKETA